MEYLLEVKGITKSFGGIKALDDVDVQLNRGEVHCLVGENGAGKSTLGKIIAGIHSPDSGQLIFDGVSYPHMTPIKAKELKIGMVTQELNLMPHLSIAENIFMFEEDSYKHSILDRKQIYKKTLEIYDKLRLSNLPSPSTRVGNLTIAQQQIVEIMKATAEENNVLIFDEPTTTLSLKEVDQLFELIRRIKQENVSIVLVTHRFKEIFEIGDLVTVLCDGKVVKGRVPIAELDEYKLVKLMIGREMKDFFGVKETLDIGEPVLEVEGLTDGKQIKDISFSVRQKEIVGFAGLVGAGRTEIMETIFGTRKMAGGTIKLNGKPLNKKSIKNTVEDGVALIPEDRKNKGLAINLSIQSNISLVKMNLKKGFVVHEGQFKESNKNMVSQLRIKHNNLLQKVSSLSGGNQQKVLLSKWLSLDPQVFIFDEPTRGIDVGTKTEIYELIKNLAKNGKAIIMVSGEMQELIAICDRIIVVNEGRIVAEFDREEATEQNILKHAIAGK